MLNRLYQQKTLYMVYAARNNKIFIFSLKIPFLK